jgi:hypothetical protein
MNKKGAAGRDPGGPFCAVGAPLAWPLPMTRARKREKSMISGLVQ